MGEGFHCAGADGGGTLRPGGWEVVRTGAAKRRVASKAWCIAPHTDGCASIEAPAAGVAAGGALHALFLILYNTSALPPGAPASDPVITARTLHGATAPSPPRTISASTPPRELFTRRQAPLPQPPPAAAPPTRGLSPHAQPRVHPPPPTNLPPRRHHLPLTTLGGKGGARGSQLGSARPCQGVLSTRCRGKRPRLLDHHSSRLMPTVIAASSDPTTAQK